MMGADDKVRGTIVYMRFVNSLNSHRHTVLMWVLNGYGLFFTVGIGLWQIPFERSISILLKQVFEREKKHYKPYLKYLFKKKKKQNKINVSLTSDFEAAISTIPLSG